MARVLRSSLPDGTFHVTSHGIDDCAVFRSDLDRLDFLYLLGIVATEHEWELRGYCLMTTHYHVVVEATTAQLSSGMHRLNGRYAQLYNQRHRRRGHVFEARFSSWVVRDERHFAATLEYVLQNPVRAGMCETADAWPWSKVDVVGEEGGEPLAPAELPDDVRQPGRRVRDVAAEKAPAAAVTSDDEREVSRGVSGSRHDDQPPVAGDVEGAGERSDGGSHQVDEHRLGEGPALREVPPQPP